MKLFKYLLFSLFFKISMDFHHQISVKQIYHMFYSCIFFHLFLQGLAEYKIKKRGLINFLLKFMKIFKFNFFRIFLFFYPLFVVYNFLCFCSFCGYVLCILYFLVFLFYLCCFVMGFIISMLLCLFHISPFFLFYRILL